MEVTSSSKWAKPRQNGRAIGILHHCRDFRTARSSGYVSARNQKHSSRINTLPLVVNCNVVSG